MVLAVNAIHGRYPVEVGNNGPGRLSRDGRTLSGTATIEDDEVRAYLTSGQSQGGGGMAGGGMQWLGGHLASHRRFNFSDSEMVTQQGHRGYAPFHMHLYRNIVNDRNTVKNRKLPMVAAGYSWGGGATYKALKKVSEDRNRLRDGLDVLATAYVDAVSHDPPFLAQKRVPPLSAKHFNAYQGTSGFPAGGPVAGSNPEWDLDIGNSHNFWSNTYEDEDQRVNLLGREEPRQGQPLDNLFTHRSIDQQQPLYHEIGVYFARSLGRLVRWPDA